MKRYLFALAGILLLSGCGGGGGNSSGNRTGPIFRLIDLGTLGHMESVSASINDSGQVVGRAGDLSEGSNHVFLYQNGTMAGLGSAAGVLGIPGKINSTGQVVGFLFDNSSIDRAFLFNNSWTVSHR
jgi:probable HAF family extracellular repeat protein